MKKIPVGATIAHAYRFAFGHYFSLLKLLWLPLLGAMGIGILLGPQLAALSMGLQTHDFSAMTMPGWLVALLFTVSMIFSFMAITGAFQLALDRRQARGRALYVSVAMPLWRMLGAFLLLALVMALLTVLYVLAVIVVLFVFRLGLAAAHISGSAFSGIMAFDGILAFLAGLCGGTFCFVRFGFLLGAATIAEDRIGLFRSWTLSHRNFWRMFWVTLAVFLPFMLTQLALQYALGLYPHVPPGLTAPQLSAVRALATQAAMARIQHYWFAYYPVLALANLALNGLMAGAGSFAWRILATGEA